MPELTARLRTRFEIGGRMPAHGRRSPRSFLRRKVQKVSESVGEIFDIAVLFSMVIEMNKPMGQL